MKNEPATVVNLLRRTDGIAATPEIQRWGVSDHAVRRAVDMGLAIRLRRGWLALPDADPRLTFAARAGVVLSCVTQAKRLGVWVLEETCTHVAAPQGSGRLQTGEALVHWSKPMVPRASGALTDPIGNVLALVSNCVPFEQALAIWESALRLDLTSLAVLRALPLGPTARKLVAQATPWSDSGLESIVLPRLRFLRVPMTTQASVLGKPVDILIGARLIVEIDGATHTGAKRDRDIEFDARARLHGYHVIRVSYVQILEHWEDVQRLIMLAVAQGLHLAA